MQHRIASTLIAALGAALLLSMPAALSGASQNNQQIVPPAQAAHSYNFVTIDPPDGFCTYVQTINDQQLATVIYSHDAQCQSVDSIL